MSVIFVFLDGVGLAPTNDRNPLATAPMPVLHALLGGPLTSEQVQQRSALLLRPLDATLGVPGLPQSGTGHTALLTGTNAPALVGRHQSHYPPVALRPLLAAQSIFQRVRARGLEAAFANAFTPGYWQALAARRLRRAASVIAAEAAGMHLRDLDDLRAGRALLWDITGHVLQAYSEAPDLPPIAPALAGQRLAGLARDHQMVFFECFLPDLVGHGRLPLSAEAVLERIDGLIGGLLETMHSTDTLLITSDHGNIEDRSTTIHTYNPVPLLVCGPGVGAFAAVTDLSGVAAGVMDALT